MCRRVILYFRRLFRCGDKFMCRETFPNRNEYYTRSCVFIDNNNNYNNGSSGNNIIAPLRPLFDSHTGPPSGNIVAYTKTLHPSSPLLVPRKYYVPHVKFVQICNGCICPPYTSGLADFAGPIAKLFLGILFFFNKCNTGTNVLICW